MIRYLYNIGNGTSYNSIQHAINSIEADLSSGETVTQDIIINVADGTYAGFTIPDGATLPLLNSTYRLVIRSAGNYYPIIDFNNSNEGNFIGADLGSANPNITIEGLRFQFFSVGVRAALNCHNVKISKCIASSNRNVGILIDQCNNSQVIQCVVSNGDFGIVSRLCKNSAIIHNTVFLNGSISSNTGTATSAIWCQQAKDYGNSDHGTLYLIGNIAWNTVGTTLSLFIDDVERGSIKSNFNNWVVGNKEKYISLEDCSFYEGANAVARRYYKSLQEWKSLGYDLNSISDDPRFFVPVRINSARNKHSIDLSLLSVSPVLGLVPSFFVDAAQTSRWLPSYVDSSDFSTDILGNDRQQGGTAAGANDRTSNSGFFGQDIFTSPLESSGAAECATNPLLDVIQKKLDLWYPKYKVGYFYSYDRDYYLYAKKRCVDIGYLAQTTFTLPARVNINQPIRLYVHGVRIEDPSYFDIRGNELILYHKDLKIINWNEEIELQYFIDNLGDEGIFYTETYIRFKIKEGKTRFFLEEDYYARGPVVITDDHVSATNKDLFCNKEFKIEWDPVEQKSEIIFERLENTVTNPQFNYFPGNPPVGWGTNSALVVSGVPGILAVAGEFLCKIPSGAYLQQELPVSTGEHVFSIYSRSFYNHDLLYNVSFYDSYGRDLGYVKTGAIHTTNDWKRYYITFGITGNSPTPVSPEDYPYQYVNHIDVPEPATKLVLKLDSLSGNIYVDAAQHEQASFPNYFHRKFYGDELTVEYETSDEEYYVDYAQSMSANITSISDGFMYIPEIPASTYGGPTSPSITTLFDFKWKAGRKSIIPWARTFGKDKLRKRILFHSYPQQKTSVIAPVFKTDPLDEIALIPSQPASLQGSSGTPITIVLSDRIGNPVSKSRVLLIIKDLYQKFPGYLHKKLYGAKEQLGQSCYGYTSNAGTLSAFWIPPSIEESIIVTEIPTPSSTTEEGEKISFIKTRYPVNLDYHGNVIILDSSGRPLKTKSDKVHYGIHKPARQGDYSIIKLTYPAVPGSVNLRINDITYTETQNSIPETNQYNIDYENSIITIFGNPDQAIVQYLVSYVFINQADTSSIQIFHDKVFGNYDGQITVCHDYVIKLIANAVDATTNTVVSKSFDLVAVNHLTTVAEATNDLYLEL